ncbi:MAG: nuclear transport factor 2 family protein [Gammaproteobacteria bacterium]
MALSNAHSLVMILPMFSCSANYQSSSVGEFSGREAIGEMMAGFFSRFPDVHWQVTDYRHTRNNLVEFEFIMTATEAATGNKIERRGLEHIEFSDDGFISRISVNAD